MGNTAFLNRNRAAVPTVQTVAPPASDPSAHARSSVGVVDEFRSGFSDAMRGRVSLIFLNTVILAMVAFYLWTRRAQGGG